MRDAMPRASEVVQCQAARCAAVLSATRPTVAYGLIAAIDDVDSDAETVAGCSNTLVRGVQTGMQLAMLVSYMPLAAAFGESACLAACNTRKQAELPISYVH